MTTDYDDRPADNGAAPSVRDYADLLYRQRWPFLTALSVILLLVVLATALVTPKYQSTASVLVRTTETDSIFPSAPDVDEDWIRQTATEIDFIDSDDFEAAIGEEAEGTIVETIQRESSSDAFNARPTTIEFTAESSDKSEAARVAQMYADTYIDLRHEIDVDLVQTSIDRVSDDLVGVRVDIDELILPLTELDLRIAAASETSELTELLRARTQIAAEVSSDLDRLESQETRLEDRLDGLRTGETVLERRESSARVVSAAEVPSGPSSPSWIRNLLLGIILGSMLGAGAVLLRESIDDKIREEEDLLSIGLQPLGRVPLLPGLEKGEKPIIHTVDKPATPASDSYRGIVTSIQFLRGEQTLKIIQVVSAEPGEGKTTTSVNLAVAMAQFGESVCIVDGDMRRPRVHEYFYVDNDLGLSGILAGVTKANDALVNPSSIPTRVIPSGPIPQNPSELLASDRFVALVKNLGDVFQTVIIDSPPVLPVPDARVIAQVVDGVILVARAGKTRKEALELAASKLRPSRVSILGAVLNGHTADARYYKYDKSGYSYSEETGDRLKERGRLASLFLRK